ncbi:hypothetical protein GB937_008116 [Aspergillus fischeri]|nr:hypothetical protein GB937_008116 [Aspergillus fischeri]
MTVHQIEQFPYCQRAIIVVIIFGKRVLKRLRNESSFRIVGATVGTVLGFVVVSDVYSKERIWKPAVRQSRRVGEVDIDDENGKDGEEDVKAQFSELEKDAPREDLPVSISIPEQGVLLKWRL